MLESGPVEIPHFPVPGFLLESPCAMSQTTDHHCPTPSIRFRINTEAYISGAHDFQNGDITNGLIAGLYGTNNSHSASPRFIEQRK